MNRETRERQGAAKARAAAREQLAMAGCDGPWDYCECCLVVLREDGFCEDCETWPTPCRVELESKLADEGDDGADNEGGPA